MDLEYDQKFEEMKKYIPFLESMIKRLESTSPLSGNPRQAQLDKIRSLRDLLLNKKKRMKMENLLKCEQVLVNLYAKVEQRDTLTDVKKALDPGFSIDAPTPQEKSDLEAVRNKLKTVVKRQEEVQETLPEILRVNEVEEMHTAGSKEPALFQRRPNKASLSPTRSPTKTNEDKLSPQSVTKRNYTRVLVSPEVSKRRWSSSETVEEKPLFSRRSPRRSPRRHSPSYHKKERKKSTKESSSRKSKDLNITLNVPEDSLSTLNTKDIFTRIINCSDGDVDIDTLRELRTQILTELRKTGARDDISDLILKSYNKKKSQNKNRNKIKKKDDVEEGELSDSESEVIENVYGNICGNLVLKDQNETKTSSDKDPARKIQICLVINPDMDSKNLELTSDVSELEMYDKDTVVDTKIDSSKIDSNTEDIKSNSNKEDIKTVTNKVEIKTATSKEETAANEEIQTVVNMEEIKTDSNKEEVKVNCLKGKNQQQVIKTCDTDESSKTDTNKDDDSLKQKHTENVTKAESQIHPDKEIEPTTTNDSVQFKANFYKPLTDHSDSVEQNNLEESKEDKSTVRETDRINKPICSKVTSDKNVSNIEAELEKMEKVIEIPLLNEPTMPKTPTESTVSEIDILQALKNEILSESISIPGSEASTPPLHQPKVIKVANSKELITKKRISIEKYKEKTVNTSKIYLDEHISSKDDNIKKTSLKLTEKECERFNIPKISFDDSSDSDDDGEIQVSDIYGDLAPKSPEEPSNIELIPPVLIPVDPVKHVPINPKADVDMRTLPILSPSKKSGASVFSNLVVPLSNEKSADKTKIDTKNDSSKSQNKPLLLDPRVRRASNQSPSPHTVHSDRTLKSVFSNVTPSPSHNVVMTPNARSYEMTPTHLSFDNDQSKKHVYPPTFSTFDSRDNEHSVVKESRWEKIEPPSERKSRFDDVGDVSCSSSDVSQSTRFSDSYNVDKYKKIPRNDRFSVDNREPFLHKSSECPRTPIASFGRSDVPVTSTQTFVRLDNPMTPVHTFGRADCPSTPSHPFGRSECPPTPSHPFGRSECPPTPSHLFGRTECPPTPIHPFGRLDCPSTPIHPFGSHSYNINEPPLTECPQTPMHLFGRNDCPTTPNHSFGRSDCPSTPSHPFGLLECPKTPSHPFGRSDTTPNIFGRSDYNSQKYAKDPRLNRKSEYESTKDRTYFSGSSYKSQRPFGSDTYHPQDREQGRNSKYRYYAQDNSGRQYNKDQSRREQRGGSTLSKDNEDDRSFSRGRLNSETRSYEEVGSRRGNQRDRSVGHASLSDQREKSISRSMRPQDNSTQSSRAAIGRNSLSELENNTLSVKSDAGRSFTIDTSVNATFQNFLDSGKEIQVFEYDSHARRERAASVGRSLVRESSVGRVQSEDLKQKRVNENKREVFRRASSMGRDLTDSTKEKRSFQEVKADFKTYRLPTKEFTKFDTGKIRNIDSKSKNSVENSNRSKIENTYTQKEEKRLQSNSKPAYSPRKNYRDPRMRKEYDAKDKYNKDPRSRKSGIVYSNDNIVRGAILTSGYGVKNYKIPKIKRVIEEKAAAFSNTNDDESTSKKNENEKDTRIKDKEQVKTQYKAKVKEPSKQKAKEVSKEKVKEMPKQINKVMVKGKINETISDTDTESERNYSDNSKSDECFERRLTRSSRKLLVQSKSKTEICTISKKSHKPIESDSDTEKDVMENKVKKEDCTNLEAKTYAHVSPYKDKNKCRKPNAVDIETSFGLDELEMFSDHVISDPVIDNINALIADLDNDLDATKNESSNDFTKEITLENMMQNITSPQEDNLSQSAEEFVEVAIDKNSELPKVTHVAHLDKAVTDVKVDFDNIKDSPVSMNTENTNTNKSKTLQETNVLLCTTQNETVKQGSSLENSVSLNIPSNEDIVSTTETEKQTISIEDKSKIDEHILDGCSTPDSTINTDDVLEIPKLNEGLADSTNELHSETNVTSTDSVDPKPSLSRTEPAPVLELGSLLTILQDKSKIKELLSMLGDQTGDNDKIKKKLEKLSEIVSDDENDDKMQKPQETLNETSIDTENKSGDVSNAIEDKVVTEDEGLQNDVVNNAIVDTDKAVTEDERLQQDDVTIVSDKALTEDKGLQNECEDNEKDTSVEDFIEQDETEHNETGLQVIEKKYKKQKPVKKSKFSKKSKARNAKKVTSIAEKRVTRATAAVETKPKPKKPPRELLALHEDIKEMFIKDDILSATGIRMCRLAKLVDEKTSNKEDVVFPEPEPVVVLEKFKNTVKDSLVLEKVKKKTGPKSKLKISIDSLPETEKDEKTLKYKPGPKSKTKNKRESDPYAFDMDSVVDTNTEKASDDDLDHSSDSEICSLTSSKSFGSTELLADIKKKTKRKRRGWQDGVIKPKHKKKKVEAKIEPTPAESLRESSEIKSEKQTPSGISFSPDMNCFTDRNYCFRKNEMNYSCRLCMFTGIEIVHHYKKEHPHVEIPLSRMAPLVAKEAIEQCKEINFHAVSKIASEKYVCIFCYKEFHNNNTVLETFFWHVVSMHTGEYKHKCSECTNENPCPFGLDIPPPPKDSKGQLIGYICKKCNFTQLSLENLKTHVIVRHNDEQTAVYTINLAAMTKKALKEFLRRCTAPELKAVTASKPSLPQDIIAKRPSAERSDIIETSPHLYESQGTQRKSTKRESLLTIQSKITFEADDNNSELSNLTSEPTESRIKIEQIDSENINNASQNKPLSFETEIFRPSGVEDDETTQSSGLDEKQCDPMSRLEGEANQASSDIVDYPHFKINITESGAKEYICCINGKDNHFKTTLLISMKKHVQLKHFENWDGYCFVCKVIVTPQGAHRFKDCFQHYLDKHMDNFPILQKETLLESSPEKVPCNQNAPIENPSTSKTYINVRPITELISGLPVDKESSSFPIIQSVMSLGAPSPSVEPPRPNPTYPRMREDTKPPEGSFRYEEVQAEVMLKKHRVVLETMMARDKLVKVYKCAGRFCSFTSDSAEDALLHASTHQRIGGVDALNCSYCDFDSMGNAIDLVMHVFKAHGHCQYSCGQCFYRAAASQSVGAHMSRVHGVAQTGASVLRTTAITTNATVEANMLTREQAVPYYVCNHAEREGSCKFRTYTPDKFCDHLKQRHAAATSHSCYVCNTEAPTAAELVLHMKNHGLKLYQCTWCVYGTDNEAELLAHVSTLHPTKQPQAYLRIITNKEGSNELRVLPLAFLNKLKVPTEDVTPSTTNENPVREAERSIDLEKLIGLTMIIEPTINENNDTPAEIPEEIEPPAELISEPIIQSSEPNVETSHEIEPKAPSPVVQSLASEGRRKSELTKLLESQLKVIPSVDSAIADPPQTDVETLPVKSEPTETPRTITDDVVVLDSDDEEDDTRRSVIDLSDEDAHSSQQMGNYKKVAAAVLGTCPKCRQVCKSLSGLKKHLFYCYPNKQQSSQCPHCSYVASNRDNIISHYVKAHTDRNTYQCGVCRVNLLSLAVVKRHLRYVHKEKDLTVVSSMENGSFCYTVNVAKVEKRELPKRKLSGNTESLVKVRYAPQDISKLPINSIFDHLVYCDLCEFSTKVRVNMVRHLQLHAESQPVAQTAPVNPVPHLETNEKHFDKMVNLASSSIATRPPAKRRMETAGSFTAIPMAPEIAALYPRQITLRERNTCSAIGCTYTSVDEPTLKRHWEALHSKDIVFRCIYCPSSQSVDDKNPITISRVISHLKMHDEKLYACSKCNYFHFKRDFLEKHLTEVHPNGKLMIVRENISRAAEDALAAAQAQPAAAFAPAPPAPAPATPAPPTMDLKPWQCGFCNFKSMLRPEVVDHCFKFHQSKMQYRCPYCPYRASAVENVNNHLAHSHANEPEDVIYYYYREGTMPDDGDGNPWWMKQRQKMGSAVPEVKTEDQTSPVQTPAASPVNIDLKLVKQEAVDEVSPGVVESIEQLYRRFGAVCEPDGLQYRCPLCSVVKEETREAMQSHLYEELKYRKWSCGLCTYKAFHKAGLTDHMTSEHRRHTTPYSNHIELPKDVNIEKWVTSQLDHQMAIIDKHKANLAKQKIVTERSKPELFAITPPTIEAVERFTAMQLEDAFGHFGAPKDMMFCCPKCGALNKDEASMKDHLETELNRIRWGCTNCTEKYQTYHEAQFHCKGHDGPSRPKEAIRDPSMRAAWVSNIIQTQKNALQRTAASNSVPPTPEKKDIENDNSLLVVRYEQRIPTPDLVPIRRKRPAQNSDDEPLVIDEPTSSKRGLRSCSYCPFNTKQHTVWREHVLKHFNLMPFSCNYCTYSNSKQAVFVHTVKCHPNQPRQIKVTEIPPDGSIMPKDKPDEEVTKLICLFCEKSVLETDAATHVHNNVVPEFAKKGDVVVKCCICLVLRLDVKSLQEHHNKAHADIPINYALFKLHHDSRGTHYCDHCNSGFKFIRDLKTHHNGVHPSLQFKYTTIPYQQPQSLPDSEDINEYFNEQPLQKRCARKSTTKLPGCNSVAKKSTTKLPHSAPSTSEGYSYYKVKPEPLEEYPNVTTLMSFCNRMMPFTLKKLSEIINIEPKVVVKDLNAGRSSDK